MSENTTKQTLTRRSFLKGAAGVGGGAALASFAGAFGISTASAANDDTQTIANLAATAETLAVTFYYAAITGAKFSVDAETLRYLRLAMDAEKYHLEVLESLGGKSLTQQFYVPANVLTDVNTFVKTALAAETAFVAAYLAATRTFGEAGQGRLAATTAQHAASEFQHLTLVRDIAGLVPNDLGLPAPIYFNVSDAVPTLAPFLKGGSGFVGPVAYPSTDQYNAALAGVKTNRVPTFTMVF